MAKFFYSEEEDYLKEESIDNYKELFFPCKLKFPILSEALEQLYTNSGISSKEVKDYTEDIIHKCES